MTTPTQEELNIIARDFICTDIYMINGSAGINFLTLTVTPNRYKYWPQFFFSVDFEVKASEPLYIYYHKIKKFYILAYKQLEQMQKNELLKHEKRT
jgi:hypothetical protein